MEVVVEELEAAEVAVCEADEVCEAGVAAEASESEETAALTVLTSGVL